MKSNTRRPLATSFDNRGTDDCPFGFVYFGDDTRVAYGSVVTDGTGGWAPITMDHVTAAKAYLDGQGFDIPIDPDLI